MSKVYVESVNIESTNVESIGIDIELLDKLCKEYNISYKYFKGMNIILLDSGLDEWQIKYCPSKKIPFCLLHKNRLYKTEKFHVQRWLRTIYQAVDCIIGHKNVLPKVFGSTR